jgi:endonuclease/exonuclease/phosphatase family metal-dependent hydrolase
VGDALRVLTWNVAGRLSRLDVQADRVIAHGSDVVCLQEVIPNALPRWMSRLQTAGYDVAASPVLPDAPRLRRLGVVIASRYPIGPVAARAGVPWPERLLSADLQPTGSRRLRVICLHAPLSRSADEAKTRTLVAVYEQLEALTGLQPAILCGDLNTPQLETREGTIQTFAQTRSGRIRDGRSECQDQAERLILRGPPGWRDAFRVMHGYAARDRSWQTGRHPGYRLDHILISPELVALSCGYDHTLRTDGLSDHSGMHATLALLRSTPTIA